MGLLGDILSRRVKRVTEWLGWLDSNQRMAVPKTAALPLGDTPVIQEGLKIIKTTHKGKPFHRLKNTISIKTQ